MRFVIIGTSGCGKTTFGRKLAERLQSPHIELDALYWGPDWTARPHNEFAEAVRTAAQQDRWVADGNYSKVRDILWTRATHIVWLNFSRPVIFSRVLRRTLLRTVLRRPLWHGNRESLFRALFTRDSILLWSWTTFASNCTRYAALRSGAEYGSLQWIECRTPSEATAFLSTIEEVL